MTAHPLIGKFLVCDYPDGWYGGTINDVLPDGTLLVFGADKELPPARLISPHNPINERLSVFTDEGEFWDWVYQDPGARQPKLKVVPFREPKP